MIPTKTFLELQIAYRKIFDKEPITDADKLGRIASLNLFNNSRWVSVDVLRQKLGQERKKLVEIEKNTRPELWKEGARWCIKFIDELLVGLEPEEAKK